MVILSAKMKYVAKKNASKITNDKMNIIRSFKEQFMVWGPSDAFSYDGAPDASYLDVWSQLPLIRLYEKTSSFKSLHQKFCLFTIHKKTYQNDDDNPTNDAS